MEIGIYQMTEKEQDEYIYFCMSGRNMENQIIESMIESIKIRMYLEKPAQWEKRAEWEKRHPELHKKQQNERSRNRRATDPQYRLRLNISNSIRQALKGNKAGQHWESLVGYTLFELKEHLEKLFIDGMSWENQGKWHIDHVRPVSSFNFTKPEDEDFKLCFALNNLQPLWAKDNLEKSNKISEKYNNL